MYVVKDLVPDMNNFYKQYKSIEPWLQRRLVFSDFRENNKNSDVYQYLFIFFKNNFLNNSTLCKDTFISELKYVVLVYKLSYHALLTLLWHTLIIYFLF